MDPDGNVPEEYQNLYKNGKFAFNKACELKAKKDELQFKVFEKAIDPFWVQFDPANRGYISKEDC